jgi:hypothetical protein
VPVIIIPHGKSRVGAVKLKVLYYFRETKAMTSCDTLFVGVHNIIENKLK